MWALKLVSVSLFFFTWAASAAECSYLARLRYRTDSEVEQYLFKKDSRIRAVETWLTKLTGKKLTATQHRRALTHQVVDTYLYIGDTEPLENQNKKWIRAVEYSAVQREFNLTKIRELNDFKSELDRLIGDAATDPHQWMERFKGIQGDLFERLDEYGLLTDGQKANFQTYTRKQLRSLLKTKLARIEKENKRLLKFISLHADDYLDFRGHLVNLVSGEVADLLREVEKVDGRNGELFFDAEVKSLEAVPRDAPDANDQISAKRENVKVLTEKITADVKRISGWIHSVGKEDSLDTELRAELEKSGYLNEELESAILNYKADAPEKKRLVSALRLLRRRLVDARTFAEESLHLDRKLGLFAKDFEQSPHVLGTRVYRPSLESFRDLIKTNKQVQRYIEWRDLKREIAAAVDNIFFYGWLAKQIPSLGRAASYLPFQKNEPLRQIILGLFSGMYNEYVSNQYFPALGILRQARSKDGAKLADILEMLNAGSSDEFLVTFARRVDMKETWNYIYADAETKKDRDPTQLFDRMQKAQVTARRLGTMGPLTETSRARYIIGSVADLALVGFLGHLSGMSFTDYAEGAEETDTEEEEEPEDEEEKPSRSAGARRP